MNIFKRGPNIAFIVVLYVLAVIFLELIHYALSDSDNYLEILDVFKYLNIVFLVSIILLLVVILPHYFMGNRRSSDGGSNNAKDNNQFIVIPANLGLIGIVIALFIKSVSGNGHNLGELIVNSISRPHQFEINLDKINRTQTHILCIDVSQSTDRAVPVHKVPKWFNEEELNDCYDRLNIKLENGDSLRSKITQKPSTEVTYFDLLKFKVMKTLSVMDKKDSLILIEFGNNAIASKSIRIQDIQNGYWERLKRLSNTDTATNFGSLFRKILATKNFRNYDKSKRNGYNLIIFSDFVHDYKKVKRAEIVNFIDRITRKNVELGISLIENRRLNVAQGAELINVKELMIADLKRKKRRYNEFDLKNLADVPVNHVWLKKKLALFYTNIFEDSIITEIKLKSTVLNEGLLSFLTSKKDVISNEGQLLYRLKENKNSEDWKLLYGGDSIPITNSSSIYLNYQGPTNSDTKQDITFNVSGREMNISYYFELILLPKLPYLVAVLLILLILTLFCYEMLYLIGNVLRIKKKD